MTKRLFIGLLFVLLVSSASAQGRYRPGDVVPEPYLKVFGSEAFFSVAPISETLKQRMEDCSFKAMGGVTWEQLRYLQVLHRDADGNALVGEMVCNERIADDLLDIFKTLYQAGYPIERIRLVEEYGGDDEASMRDNNTSCFNQRATTAGGTLSKHSYGLAVDINPRYNPYMKLKPNGQTVVRPEGSEDYLERTLGHPYQIIKGDLCYRLFRQHGFIWGGEWLSGKDYQHFEALSQTSNR